jgi:hypothetical protein
MPLKITSADFTFKKALLPRLADNSNMGGSFWQTFCTHAYLMSGMG